MYESTVDFKKSWEHFRSFFFSWPQQNNTFATCETKVGSSEATFAKLHEVLWRIKGGKISWASTFAAKSLIFQKKSLQDAEQIHQKLQGLQTLSRHRESCAIFFLETWWKDYCTLQHVFDWVELNQSMSCHKQILEGRCFLSGEVQTFAQFPRYLVESQVFTLYMFPLKSCKKSPGTPDFPQQESHLPHREVVWAANPPRTGVANLHPAPKTCLFLGNEAPVRRTNSDPERWGTPRLTRTDDAVRRLTGDCCRFYGCPMKQHIYIYTYIHINTYTS